MFDQRRTALDLEEISGVVGNRPVCIVEEYLHVFNVEWTERTDLLRALLPYLTLVTVAFHSRRASGGKYKELLSMATTKKKLDSGTKKYLVTWEMDIEADSPRLAAAEALLHHRDPEGRATHFKVSDEDGNVTDVEF